MSLSLSARDTMIGTPATLSASHYAFVTTPDGRISSIFKGQSDYTPQGTGTYKVHSYASTSDTIIGQVQSASFNASKPNVTMIVSSNVADNNVQINAMISNSDSIDYSNLTYAITVLDASNNIVYWNVRMLNLGAISSQNVSDNFVGNDSSAYLGTSDLSFLGLYELQTEKTPISVGNASVDRVIIRSVDVQDLYSPLDNVTMNVALQSYAARSIVLSIPELNYSQPVVVNGMQNVMVDLGRLNPDEYQISLVVLNGANQSMIYDVQGKTFYVQALDVGIMAMNTSSVFYSRNASINVSMSLKNLDNQPIDANVSLKVIDPNGTATIVSTNKSNSKYYAQFTMANNGTYLLTSVVDKPGFRIYDDSLYIIVGQASRIRANYTIINSTIAMVFYANGKPTDCNVTIASNGQTSTLLVTDGWLFLESNGTVDIVADKMMFEPAFLTVNQPISSFSATSHTDDTVAFDASASSGLHSDIASYEWDFGDGSNATTNTSTISHAYAYPGIYYVMLSVTDANGATGIGARNIDVNSADMYQSTLINSTIPSSLTANQSCNVSVTMRNDGRRYWSLYDNIALCAFGNNTTDDYKVGSMGAVIGDITVLPGQSYTFNLTLNASEIGTYALSYRMAQGYNWFGDMANATVVVSPPLAPNATNVSDTIPARMQAGQSYNVSIAMVNTGSLAWSEGNGIRLGVLGDAALFGPVTVGIPAGTVVEPNDTYTFNFTMTAPNVTGTYFPTYRMVQYGNQWFGDIVNKTVVVNTASIPVASYVATPVSGFVPLNVQFNDTSTNSPATWQWSFGDGTVNSSLQNPAHEYNAAGTYNVTLTVTNADGSNSTMGSAILMSCSPVPLPIFQLTRRAVRLHWSCSSGITALTPRRGSGASGMALITVPFGILCICIMLPVCLM